MGPNRASNFVLVIVKGNLERYRQVSRNTSVRVSGLSNNVSSVPFLRLVASLLLELFGSLFRVDQIGSYRGSLISFLTEGTLQGFGMGRGMRHTGGTHNDGDTTNDRRFRRRRRLVGFARAAVELSPILGAYAVTHDAGGQKGGGRGGPGTFQFDLIQGFFGRNLFHASIKQIILALPQSRSNATMQLDH